MTATFAETRDGMIRALTFAPAKPTFLRDVLKMKRERGDNDCDGFKRASKEFGSGLNATVRGAANAMRQWVAKEQAGGEVFLTYSTFAEREAFLADLDQVIDGTFDTRKAVA
jgi:hypothetical protein